jgi:hypothetical protein
MRGRTARRLTAGGSALGAVGAMLVLATPAQACTCGHLDIDAALAEGRTLALVTRTDTAANDARTAALPTATFRVEGAAGPKPPATLTGAMDTGGSCRPYVAPGSLAALVFQRKAGAWDLGWCTDAELGLRRCGGPRRGRGRPGRRRPRNRHRRRRRDRCRPRRGRRPRPAPPRLT